MKHSAMRPIAASAGIALIQNCADSGGHWRLTGVRHPAPAIAHIALAAGSDWAGPRDMLLFGGLMAMISIPVVLVFTDVKVLLQNLYALPVKYFI